MACGCPHFGMTYGYYRLGAAFVCRHRYAEFIGVRAILSSKVYPINDNKLNQWLSIYWRTGIIRILVTIIISNI